jgi:hypothetical protein
MRGAAANRADLQSRPTPEMLSMPALVRKRPRPVGPNAGAVIAGWHTAPVLAPRLQVSTPPVVFPRQLPRDRAVPRRQLRPDFGVFQKMPGIGR